MRRLSTSSQNEELAFSRHECKRHLFPLYRSESHEVFPTQSAKSNEARDQCAPPRTAEGFSGVKVQRAKFKGSRFLGSLEEITVGASTSKIAPQVMEEHVLSVTLRYETR